MNAPPNPMPVRTGRSAPALKALRCPPTRASQRGMFAIVTVLMLLVVVASALRFMLAAAESNSSATLAHQQSTKALLAADSGIEAMLAKMRKAGPMSCAGASFTSGTLDGASYAMQGVSSIANIPVSSACNGMLVAHGCRGQVQGSVGASTRTVSIDIAYCSPTSAGVAGFGGYTTNIAQTINPYQANSVIVSNLAFRRKSDAGGPNTSATTCSQTGTYSGTCTQGWSIQSSSGIPSVGGRGVIATTTSVGDYSVVQNLGADRNYVATGAIFVAIIFGQVEAGLAAPYGASHHLLDIHTTIGWSLAGVLSLLAAWRYVLRNRDPQVLPLSYLGAGSLVSALVVVQMLLGDRLIWTYGLHTVKVVAAMREGLI